MVKATTLYTSSVLTTSYRGEVSSREARLLCTSKRLASGFSHSASIGLDQENSQRKLPVPARATSGPFWIPGIHFLQPEIKCELSDQQSLH